jgi:hypothetical protein
VWFPEEKVSKKTKLIVLVGRPDFKPLQLFRKPGDLDADAECIGYSAVKSLENARDWQAKKA